MEKTTKSIHTRADVTNDFPAATPIYQNSAFESQSDFFYSRKNNPNVDEFETAVRILEGTDFALATPTGMSAIMTTIALLKPGQRILLNKQVYGCTFKLFQWYADHYGLDLQVADLTLGDLSADLPTVDCVFFETPTNPFLLTVNIQKVADFFKAKNKDCLIVVDNTWATPLYQSPCSHGADVSLHSATKYLSGHSDVMGGIILCDSSDLAAKLRSQRFYSGANLDPHSAWLLRRSLHTLEIRLEKHGKTTRQLVDYLRTKDEVLKVYYPAIDGEQLTAYPTLVFIDVRDEVIANYQQFHSELALFSTGTGMACVTSMIAQPFTGSHASMEDGEKADMGLGKNTLRLSFGMENAEDLIADLENAFNAIK
jgi:cystathionine gamma-lyase/cystathionine gamma-lyase/homocysteine desulfhydrase